MRPSTFRYSLREASTSAGDFEVAIDGGENQAVPEGGFPVEGLAVGSHEAVFSDGSSVGFEISNGLPQVLITNALVLCSSHTKFNISTAPSQVLITITNTVFF